MNKLFYGDNLDILRKKIREETVDLCYIDPPFNSKRNYNQIDCITIVTVKEIVEDSKRLEIPMSLEVLKAAQKTQGSEEQLELL